MRILLQRVTEARVTVADRTTGEIGPGLVLLVGLADRDASADLQVLADKIANLRVFEDAEGRMNLSALDLKEAGQPMSMLVVSQFTLYADVRKGRRPSFTDAARPEVAQPLVEMFVGMLVEMGFGVQQGEFGAHMQVSLVNDGPVTVWLDSDEFRNRGSGANV